MGEDRIGGMKDRESMWVCKHCQLVFAFDSHIRAHKILTGHTRIIRYELPSTNTVRESEHI
jgi:hypothetical protein